MKTNDHELGYDGMSVAITGVASGIGEATARLLGELGADVIGLDIATPQVHLHRFIPFDLRDEDSIARAATSVGTSLDALFHCAGQPQTAPGLDVLLTGFVGLRELTERLRPSLMAGGSITCVASTAAYAWPSQLERIRLLLDQPTYAAAAAWCRANIGTRRGELRPGQGCGQRLHGGAEFRPRPPGHPHQLHQSRPDGDSDDRGIPQK